MIILLLSIAVVILAVVVLRLHKNIDAFRNKHKEELKEKDEEAAALRRRLSSSRRFGGLAPIESAQSTHIGSILVETYTKNEDAEGQHFLKVMYRISNDRTGASITFSDVRFERIIIALRAARKFSET